jgi:hypothetical protein
MLPGVICEHIIRPAHIRQASTVEYSTTRFVWLDGRSIEYLKLNPFDRGEESGGSRKAHPGTQRKEQRQESAGAGVVVSDGSCGASVVSFLLLAFPNFFMGSN